MLGSTFRTLATSMISSGKAVGLLLGTVPCVYTNTGGPGPNTDTAIGSAALFEEISSCFIWETNKSTNQACTSKDHQQVRELHHGAWDAAGKTQTRCISCSPACGSPLAAEIQHSSRAGDVFILLKREGHFSALKKYTCLLEFQIV